MKLSEAIKILDDAGVPDAAYDAREIFSNIGGIKKAKLFIGDMACGDVRVLKAIERRAKREPLQYIIGKTYFYREEYIVNENVLIPRADTETLVEYACGNIPDGESFIDLCTGSGCVGISTLKNTRETSAVLVDISEAALSVAKENAELNRVLGRAEFKLCDVMREECDGEYFAVLSNPPYVADSVYENLDSEIFFEPKIAFVGGFDGADFYKRLTSIYKNKIKAGGFIAYEIGYDQGALLLEIAQKESMTCEIIKDLSGNDRVAVLRKKS